MNIQTPHPATFNQPILNTIQQLLDEQVLCLKRYQHGPIHLLDPFAGTGKIHELASSRVVTHGIEIEPEWARQNPNTTVGNALDLPYHDGSMDVIATSPCYGNRMADTYTDGTDRITYTAKLGKPLNPDNAGSLQWGAKYRDFHARAWSEATRVARSDGFFILNMKDHVRGGRIVPVTEWHYECLTGFGWEILGAKKVESPGMRRGQNHELRVSHETVTLFGR